ncbi:TonB-dependent receptor [Winogradskyella sp. J14-2]|uniref:TonB-dependent receptor n=1 Tax=Winogradskyella sp. J14-2 TaxID=1936080 RepID=UPI000972DA17|nr:carboxypeptidase-like regulatory domain-containing protein [Winogradskyella sp. J14-2]APY08673.1 TonB-dependent receptor [Winogradskyella sp. J14-2]
MKKFNQFLFATVIMLFTTAAFAQVTITGMVVDGETSSPLPGANVLVKGTTNGATTDFDGNFSLTAQSNSGEIVISYVGFGSKTIKFSGDTNVGTVSLYPDNSLDEVIVVGSGVIDLAEDRKTPVAVSTIRKTEIQERAVGNVEVPEILKNTPSAYVSNQTGFGDGEIFLRGFDQTNTAVLLNGQPVNGMEDGRVYWSNWAGIADVANGVQVQRGLGASKLAISSVGGTINLIMKSSEKSQGGFVRFLGGNDSYVKTTAGYDSGINDKGWSFSVLLDHWQAHRKWARGTYGQGQTYFFSVGYKPNEQHNLNLLLTGAPQLHGQRWSQSQEIIDADPKFNQHWGYTEDGIESERQNYYHKPVLNLNWDWNISEKSDLSTVLYASWGRGGGTGPRGNGRIRTADPDGDGPLYGQIDYDAITAQNQQIGIGGDYGGPLGAGYIRRSSVNNHQWYGLVSNFSTDLTEQINFNAGVDFRFYRGDHFRQVADFYGLTGWSNDRPDGAIVTESFDPTPWAALFDFADEGQRIDYDYSENINYQGVFSQIEYANEKFSAFFQGALSNQSYVREGRFEDPGESDKLNKIGYNLKAGLSYNIGEQSTIFGNFGFYSRQPFLDNIFENIRRSNAIVDNPEVDNEEITGIELGYVFEVENFKAIFNFYYTDWDNRTILGSDQLDNGTPDDDSDDIFLNIFDRGVRQVHKGVELDLQYRLTDKINLTGYVSSGSWEFEGESNVSIYNSDTGELLGTADGVNREGVKISTAPQFTAGFGVRAEIINDLDFYGNINYYDRHWLNDGNSVQTENVGRIDPFSLTDIGLTYNFMLGANRLTLTGNVFNLFDNITIQNSDRFGLINTNGRTFNASVRYSF